MSNYSLTDQAIEDINEICEYLSNFNLDSATEFLNSIENKCQTLVQFPNMGRSYAELSPELRGISVNPYIIFYRLIKDDVEIIRVVNGYRNLESLFSESEI
ncbi:type II toxin-antitoxin system RelE/ParE family toxin [Anabaena lutea]|uniref:Type II toxin-antitoxin system RelE/ParE family toxin n=1 Tax=Anabaena lutea FACHB-196 TaxID=2692881 RepID=A0ABR8FF56_9NOST|nr:type II toxin-antitoxin system RelE/ParE family toxin [Anabaena lutea]MBD2568470.1 type II toxin-antitoxin system RelE/ParE family toxin [Anabaena lutea FACHB-196]